jgi:hypothetical protein
MNQAGVRLIVSFLRKSSRASYSVKITSHYSNLDEFISRIEVSYDKDAQTTKAVFGLEEITITL